MKKDVINLYGHLEERTSKEGNKYEVLILQITDDYEKEVYYHIDYRSNFTRCLHIWQRNIFLWNVFSSK